MNAIERIKQAVDDAQRDGYEQGELAGVLMSFAAGYALQIGWDPEVVAGAQRIALAEHIQRRAQKGSSRT